MKDTQGTHGIILFDGVCNLCNSTVRRIIKNDPKGQFRFAPLQSEKGRLLLQERGLNPDYVDSVLLIIPGVAYYEASSAAIEIGSQLRYYSWIRFFSSVPEPLRDAVYHFIARNRYKWFGRKNQCPVPSPDIQNRFLG